MYAITSLIKSEIKDNYEFTKEQAEERNIKFYSIHSLFTTLLKDFYANKYGAQHIEHFDVFIDKFNLTLKTYPVLYHIVVNFSNVFDYKLSIQVTSKGNTYIFITRIKDNIKHEASFNVNDFNKISFDESGELAQTFKNLIETFNK